MLVAKIPSVRVRVRRLPKMLFASVVGSTCKMGMARGNGDTGMFSLTASTLELIR